MYLEIGNLNYKVKENVMKKIIIYLVTEKVIVKWNVHTHETKLKNREITSLANDEFYRN